jgi:hypothetical protein
MRLCAIIAVALVALVTGQRQRHAQSSLLRVASGAGQLTAVVGAVHGHAFPSSVDARPVVRSHSQRLHAALSIPLQEDLLEPAAVPTGNCSQAIDLPAAALPSATKQAFQCMVAAGWTQLSIPVTRNGPNCSIDKIVITTVQNAQAAGFTGVDLLVAPLNATACPEDPASQMSDVFAALDSASLSISRIWIDVTSSASPSGWGSDCGANRHWLGPALRNAARRLGFHRVGVKSSSSDWTTLMCNAQDLSQLSLWYVHQDNQSNMNDWKSIGFGGWQQPLAKQFAAQSTCGLQIDLDFRMQGVCEE